MNFQKLEIKFLSLQESKTYFQRLKRLQNTHSTSYANERVYKNRTLKITRGKIKWLSVEMDSLAQQPFFLTLQWGSFNHAPP